MQGKVHEHTLRVRYGETDQMGVVHHVNFLVYMEEGRTRFMRSLGCPYSELEARGWTLVVRRADLRYRSPALYDWKLRVRTCVGRVRSASVTFLYEILRDEDGELLVEGSTELACLDARGSERKPSALPEDLKRVLLDGKRAEPA